MNPVGSKMRCKLRFKDANGDPADPSVVTFEFKPPSEGWRVHVFGESPDVTKEAVGVYRMDITGERLGTYEVKGLGSGNVNAPARSTFTIG